MCVLVPISPTKVVSVPFIPLQTTCNQLVLPRFPHRVRDVPRYLDKVTPQSSDGTRSHPLFCLGFKRSRRLDRQQTHARRCCCLFSSYAYDNVDDSDVGGAASVVEAAAELGTDVEVPAADCPERATTVRVSRLTKTFPVYVDI